jgi:hypothetical protein
VEVIYAFLCDYADNTGGKLDAIGVGIDTIYAPAIPTRHPLMYAVIALRFSMLEVGEKRLDVHIIDADGNDVVPPLKTTLNVQPPPPGYIYRVQRIALGLFGTEFPRYGDYQVSWLVDGQEAKTVPLKVVTPPSSSAAHP